MGFHYEDAASRRRRGWPLSTEASYGLSPEMKKPPNLGHYRKIQTETLPNQLQLDFPVPFSFWTSFSQFLRPARPRRRAERWRNAHGALDSDPLHLDDLPNVLRS
jgi:hypothetical protein